MSARGIVEDVLTTAMTKQIWTSDYRRALPIGVQHFDLSAVLPAVFYMFRFGHRRGKGLMQEEFGQNWGTLAQRRRSLSVKAVANKLAGKDENGKDEKFHGFGGKAEQAILGDLLLCYCLTNIRHGTGRTKQIQRVAPCHYMASWVDLPDSVGHLRHVPEMIVAMLANQKDTPYVEHNPKKGKKTWFPVGEDVDANVLLKPFADGITRDEDSLKDDYAADQFIEKSEESRIGIDQLLMIRMAQRLGRAPGKLKGEHRISNRRPVAAKAASDFSEDLRKYVRAYAGAVPRQTFVETLESCLSVGLTTIVTSVMEIVLAWAENGRVRKRGNQHPPAVFVDCSSGTHRELRGMAEQSMDEHTRRASRFPVVLMALRILDYKARYDRIIKKSINVRRLTSSPHSDEWMNLLGDLLHDRHPRSGVILDALDESASVLEEKLRADYPETAALLTCDQYEPNPVWRLAEGLTALQGAHLRTQLDKLIDSALFADRPNGLAAKRKVRRKVPGTATQRTMTLRSLVLTDAVLEYLVHRHLLKPGGASLRDWFSFDELIDTLLARYGLCIDVSPPDMTISNELLQLNRSFLDRRLRDLGLLVSVNDAEAMKRLTPRFTPSGG